MLTLLPLLAFAVVSLLVLAGAMALSPSSAGTIEQRLFELSGRRPITADRTPKGAGVAERFLTAIGRKAPRSPAEMGELQRRLVAAGYRKDGALTLFIGVRLAFSI